MSLKEEIRKSFSYLFDEFGFRILETSETDFVVAQSEDIRLRFIRERSDFFLDIGIASDPNHWRGFFRVVDEMRRCGKISFVGNGSNKMKPVRSILRKTFPLVREYLLKGGNS